MVRRSRNKPQAMILRSDFIYVHIDRVIGTTTDDTFGEDSDPTWTRQYTDAKCHKESNQQQTGAQGLGITPPSLISISEFLFIFESDILVKTRDRITDIDGNTFRVNEVKPYETHREAFADAAELT